MTPVLEQGEALARMLHSCGQDHFRTFVAAALAELQDEGFDADIALISYLQVCDRFAVDPDPVPDCLLGEPATALRGISARRRLMAL